MLSRDLGGQGNGWTVGAATLQPAAKPSPAAIRCCISGAVRQPRDHAAAAAAGVVQLTLPMAARPLKALTMVWPLLVWPTADVASADMPH